MIDKTRRYWQLGSALFLAVASPLAAGCKTTEDAAKVADFNVVCNFLAPFLSAMPTPMTMAVAVPLKATSFGAAFLIQKDNNCSTNSLTDVSQKSLNEIAAIVADQTNLAFSDKEKADLVALYNSMQSYAPLPVSTYRPDTTLPNMLTASEELTQEFKSKTPALPYLVQFITASALRLKLYQENLRVTLETAAFAKNKGDDPAPYIATAKTNAQRIIAMIQDTQDYLTTLRQTEVPKTVTGWFKFNNTLQHGRSCYGFDSDPAQGYNVESPSSACNWAACYDITTSGSDQAGTASGHETPSVTMRKQYAQQPVCMATQIANAPSLKVVDSQKTQLDSGLMLKVKAKLTQQLATDLFGKGEVITYRKAAVVIQKTMQAVVDLPTEQFFTAPAQTNHALMDKVDLSQVTLPDDTYAPCGPAVEHYATALARVQFFNDVNFQGDSLTLESTDLRPRLGLSRPGPSGLVKFDAASAKVSCIAPSYSVYFSSYDSNGTQTGFTVAQPGASADINQDYPGFAKKIGFIEAKGP